MPFHTLPGRSPYLCARVEDSWSDRQEKKRTMSLDGDSKFLRLVEDIVEILVVQLGPEERVPVHFSRSVEVPRLLEI